jgi:polyferredoxin
MQWKFRGRGWQGLTIWLFFLIAIGGLWFPVLGYLMLGMMLMIPVLAYWRGRYWCGNLCPRGAFLDIVLYNFSPRRPFPRAFTQKRWRWGIFAFIMTVFAIRLYAVWGNWLAVGGLFVNMCVVTSIVAIALGLLFNQRTWCAICPMGTLQESLGKLGSKTASKHS